MRWNGLWALAAAAALAGCEGSTDDGTNARGDAAPGADAAPGDDAATDAGPTPDMGGEPEDPGALIAVRMDSQVGVLLDEVPESMRERVATAILAKPAAFWEARARRQVEATTYRLSYRNFFYDDKGQLPLPPAEQWRFTVGAPSRGMVDGHDLVLVDYAFESTLLTDVASVTTSEEALGTVGGMWEEPFSLPVDPELVLERTGYACMDEADFPPNSVDSENALQFYDQDCEGGPTDCHLTEPIPTHDCVTTVRGTIGVAETTMQFERLAWDAALADMVRVGAPTIDGAELEVIGAGLENNRLIYRYFPADSCAIAEGCIGGPGWRRLLQFDASVKNLGKRPVHIGDVSEESLAAQHNMFEFSACHEHNHFSHYGAFSYGNGDQQLGSKKAFCLESVTRYGNNEFSPLTHPYGCHFQGVQAGWGDDYIAGLDCQWVDVTPVDTSAGPVTAPLTFHLNPDGFLCEGNPVLDGEDLTFEPTDFRTEAGAVVDRIVCEQTPGYDANNVGTLDVTVPPDGSYVTTECKRGQLGERRNCGFTEARDQVDCPPGQPVRLRCSTPGGAAPQVLRVCDHSAALGTGIACTYLESLTTVTADAAGVDVEFTCPAMRDPMEPGGAYSLFTTPVFAEDAAAPVTCAPR